MKKKLFLFIFCLNTYLASATFISEVGFDVKRYYSRFYEVCSDGYRFTGGGISIAKRIKKEKLYIFSGLNYLPSAVCAANRKAKYLQIPIELRYYFIKKIIFVEPSIDIRWLTNWKSIEYSSWLTKFSGGYGLALGLQQHLSKNLFVNLKAYSTIGFTPKQHVANMTNYGFEAGISYSFR